MSVRIYYKDSTSEPETVAWLDSDECPNRWEADDETLYVAGDGHFVNVKTDTMPRNLGERINPVDVLDWFAKHRRDIPPELAEFLDASN